MENTVRPPKDVVWTAISAEMKPGRTVTIENGMPRLHVHAQATRVSNQKQRKTGDPDKSSDQSSSLPTIDPLRRHIV